MENTENFFEWFRKLGGDNRSFCIYNTHQTLNNIQLKFSSLKSRPEDIKAKYNHKFNFN